MRRSSWGIGRVRAVAPSAAAALAVVAGLAAVATLAGCTSFIDGFTGRKEACAILAIGTPASAVITRLVDTGASINDNPVVEFVLRVSPPGGEPYEARTKGLVGRLDVAAFPPGRVLPVKFDPANPSRVAIDLWECEKK
jgi:hypothetical protein